MAVEFIDVFAVVNGVGSFLVFIFLQICVFRFIQQENVINGLKTLLVIGALVNVGVGISPIFLKITVTGKYTVGSIVFCSAVSLMIYALLVYLYSLYFFGVAESSIRIRILYEVAKRAPHWVSLDQINNDYNEDTIIRKRLSRFVNSGEIKVQRGKYSINKRFSIFFLQERAIHLLRRILTK